MCAFTPLLLLAAALAPTARAAGRSLQQPMATAPLQPEPLPAAAREQPITVEAPMGLVPLTELLAGFAPAPEAEVAERGLTLLEIVRRRATRDLVSLSLLIEAVPGATELLSSHEVPVTLFAPNDEAFARRLSQLGLTQLSQLLQQPELARAILLIHVVPGAFASSALREDIALPTALAGEVLNVDTPRGEVLLTPPAGGPARIVQADIRSAEGGFIDIIDTVLLPTAALGLALAPAPEGEAIFIAPAAEAAPALPAGPAAVVQPPVAIVPAGAAPAGQAPGGAATVPAGTPVVVQPTPP